MQFDYEPLNAVLTVFAFRITYGQLFIAVDIATVAVWLLYYVRKSLSIHRRAAAKRKREH
jgi:hypothetical protein